MNDNYRTRGGRSFSLGEVISEDGGSDSGKAIRINASKLGLAQ